MTVVGVLTAGAAAGVFAILYQNPWRAAAVAGLVAAVSWVAAAPVGASAHGAVLADLVGALVAGLLSEGAARRLKEPVSVFVVPAIIPFVPGYAAYESMAAFLNGQFILGWQRAGGMLLAAGALAVGLALATAVARTVGRTHL
jgi:uncharacterized membrane protein YjjB (DUF3815 family)